MLIKLCLFLLIRLFHLQLYVQAPVPAMRLNPQKNPFNVLPLTMAMVKCEL